MISITESITGSEPLSLSLAKAWCRVTYTDEDMLITSLITQARDVIEQYLNVSMIDKTLTLDMTKRSSIQLPFGPVQAITSIKDSDGEGIDYDVKNEFLQFNQIVDYARIIYTVGYDTVPSGLILGLKQVILRYFENRGDAQNSVGLLTDEITTIMAYSRKQWI